jgi:hypothetical protein
MKRLEFVTRVRLFLAATSVLVAVGGCAVPQASDFKPSKLFSLGDDDEPRKGMPTRIVGTWTDTVLTQPGQTPQRGFGGRLMFYDRKNDKPVLVDGQLVVYAFDETGREPTDNKPTRRYVFPPEVMPLHMSKSEIGASYSFWLPWDEAGGPQTEVSLICRFEPKNGAVITGEQTRHRLPGKLPAEAAIVKGSVPKLPEGVPSRPAQTTLEGLQAQRAADQQVRLAGYAAPAAAGAAAAAGGSAPSTEPQRMTTTSITLPKSYSFPAIQQSVSPTKAAPAAATPALLPAQPQAQPIQSMRPAAMQPQVSPQPVQPAALQAAPVPTSRFGAFPVQPAIGPTVATPTVYSPTSAGFGFAAAAQQPPQTRPSPTTQVTSSQLVPSSSGPQTVTWNRTQSVAAQLLQQHAQMQTQPKTIVQPASQPLPPPTGITTTVIQPTLPPQAALLR